MEETLLKLDEYFADKKQKIIYFAGAFIAIFYALYMGIYDLADQSFNDDQSAYNEAQAKYAALEDLESISAQIRKFQQLSVENRQTLSDLKKNNEYLGKEIKDLSDSFFDPNGINPFLNHVSMEARDNGVSVTKVLNNSQSVEKLKFDRLYDVGIKFTNVNFASIVRYVNSLEETNKIIDINNLDLNTSANDINGSLNIIAWGIKY